MWFTVGSTAGAWVGVPTGLISVVLHATLSGMAVDQEASGSAPGAPDDGDPPGADVRVLAWNGDDAELLERVQQGGAGAAALLYDRFAPEVNRMVWRLTGVDRDHDDLVQQVFCELLAGVHKVRDPGKLRGWVLTVTVNIVRSEFRKRSVRRRFMTDPGDEDPGDRSEGDRADHEARSVLRQTYEVLDKLPAQERVAFTLRYIDSQSLEDTAELCGCSLATIKRRLGKAEKRFTSLACRYPDLAERLRRGARWGEGS